MGKALATPKLLPFLFIVPIVIIALLVLKVTGGDFGFIENDIIFGNFIPHGWIEALFMTGNAVIFLFAFIGLWKFWKGLKSGGSGNGPGFISSLIQTLIKVIIHRDFFECNANKPRSWAHILVLFGFLGSMATAGLAVMSMLIFHLDPPIPMTHPIKWLGNVAGFAGFIGMLIIIFRRLKGRDEVGANGYPDWLFIIMLFSVFTTGLLTQFSRLADAAVFAYSIYYIHLVVVFFLLWYMPYSKFAHMIYRTMALVHAKQEGRK
jgi:quinone-modifying oxidoreductase subunit QmoC